MSSMFIDSTKTWPSTDTAQLLVPAEMRSVQRWVCQDNRRPKLTTWKNVEVFDTFETAITNAARSQRTIAEFSRDQWGAGEKPDIGVGIGFFAGSGISFIDLDHVLDMDGSVYPARQKLVDTVLAACPSYVEVSPSGMGLHIFCYGDVDAYGPICECLEIYSTTSRHATVSGNPYHTSSPFTNCQAGLEALLALRTVAPKAEYTKSAGYGTNREERIVYCTRASRGGRWDAIRNTSFAQSYYDHKPGVDRDAALDSWWTVLEGRLRSTQAYDSYDEKQWTNAYKAASDAYADQWLLPARSMWYDKAAQVLDKSAKDVAKNSKAGNIRALSKAAFKAGQVAHIIGLERVKETLTRALVLRPGKLFPEQDESLVIEEQLAYGAGDPLFVEASWHVGLLWTANKDAPLVCAGNTLAAFRHPDMVGVLKYDERFNKIILTRRPPWEKHDKDYPRPWIDVDDIAALEWLPRLTPPIMAHKGWIADAVSTIAHEHAFDPFVQYLDSLSWDGKDRLDIMMHEFCGADDTTLNKVFFRKWMISAVARTYQPGCKADAMLVLVSDQGLKKSTFWYELLPDPKFLCEGLPKGKDKDAQQALQGPVIIEDSEMSHFSSKDIESTKEFISIRSDRYRESYGHHTTEHPRRVVLCGSTNDDELLHDATGGRRFWPVTVTQIIPVELLKEVRDQLWAEAAARYRRNEQWWLTGDEEAMAGIIQEICREVTPVEEALSAALSGLHLTGSMSTLVPEQLEAGKIQWITCKQAIELIGGRIDNKALQIQTSQALRALGWRKGARIVHEKLGRPPIYKRPWK